MDAPQDDLDTKLGKIPFKTFQCKSLKSETDYIDWLIIIDSLVNSAMRNNNVPNL